jgi:hypothetical protein
MLDTFTKVGNCMEGNEEIIETLKQLAGSLTASVDDVLMTLIALYLLQEKFEDREDEWSLIAKKAKTWLKQVGVTKPEKLIGQINMVIQ